jgi:hypothetical protein
LDKKGDEDHMRGHLYIVSSVLLLKVMKWSDLRGVVSKLCPILGYISIVIHEEKSAIKGESSL